MSRSLQVLMIASALLCSLNVSAAEGAPAAPAHGPYGAPYGSPYQSPYGPPRENFEPGYHTHDGFFLRFTPGISYGLLNETYRSETAQLTGGGISGSFAIGGAVANNFVLCFELSALSVSDPNFKSSGGSRVYNDTTWSVQYFGAGASYYFGDNFFFHFGLGGAYMTLTAHGDSDDTDTGFAGKLMFGKEWWASTNWGLGIEAHLIVADIPPKSAPSDLTMITGIAGLGFSATYN